MQRGCTLPSYYELMEALMAERGPDHPIWEDNDKIKGRQLGEISELHVPQIYYGPGKLRSFPNPERDCVIKPVNGCSARGIFPLLWLGEDKYRNLFTGRKTTWAVAVTEALEAKHSERNKALIEQGHPDAMRPPWIIEELIHDDGVLPCDWKAFCFGGRVEAVFQMARKPNRNTKPVRWWSRDWRDIGSIMPIKTYRRDSTLRPPNDPQGMIDAFERVAQVIDSPFIRVDLYEQGDRIVFGEVTPHPTGNTSRFNDTWDRKFGEAWEAAL